MGSKELALPSKRQVLIEYLIDDLLPTITTDNNYNSTLKTIKQGLLNPRSLIANQLPAVFIPGVTERRNLITGNQFKAVMEVNLVCFV